MSFHCQNLPRQPYACCDAYEASRNDVCDGCELWFNEVEKREKVVEIEVSS